MFFIVRELESPQLLRAGGEELVVTGKLLLVVVELVRRGKEDLLCQVVAEHTTGEA